MFLAHLSAILEAVDQVMQSQNEEMFTDAVPPVGALHRIQRGGCLSASLESSGGYSITCVECMAKIVLK